MLWGMKAKLLQHFRATLIARGTKSISLFFILALEGQTAGAPKR
jgi:hypothetical protein